MPAKRTIFLTVGGRTEPLEHWVRASGLPASTILSRVRRLGWDPEQAVTTPADKRFTKGGGHKTHPPRPAPVLAESADGRAYCRWTIDGHRSVRYFGAWGSDAARAEYGRFAAEWHTNGGRPPVASGEALYVAELVTRFMDWAGGYYTKNDRRTSETVAYRSACRPLVELYGDEAAAAFGPNKLRVVQARYVEAGYSRKTCNEYTGRVVRVFSWAVSREMIPAATADALKHVERLVAGRTTAPDSDRIAAAPLDDVLATIPHLHPVAPKRELLELMVRTQLLCRMRPGELIAIRTELIDRTRVPWRYEVVEANKTRHLEKRRLVLFGPEARALLGPLIEAAVAGGSLWRFSGRKRPLSVQSYARFVVAACGRAKVPVWHPRQLRKTGATFVQRKYESDEAVAIALGNTPEVARQVYVDDPSEAAAVRIAEATG
jgi:integrase